MLIMMSLQCDKLAASKWILSQSHLYPPSPPNCASMPYLVTSGNNKTVAIWFDGGGQPLGYGSMHSATLDSNLVDNQGELNWNYTSPVAYNVLLPFTTQTHPVGIDAQGNALTVWTDNDNNILVSRLPVLESNWNTFPNPINNKLNNTSSKVSNPYISVAPNGNAVVLWTKTINSMNFQTVANVYNAQTNAWKGERVVYEGSTDELSNINHVAVDEVGNAIAVVTTPNRFLKTSVLNFETNNWTSIKPLLLDATNAQVSATMDSEGNATLVWIDDYNMVYGISLLSKQLNYSNKFLLSENGNTFFSVPVIKNDAQGNAIAVWPENLEGLGSARYSRKTGKWTILAPHDLVNKIPVNISLSVDVHGNAVATWAIYRAATEFIQSAVLPLGYPTWQQQTQLSPNMEQNQNPHVVITSSGTVVVVWENDIGQFLSGIINSSVNLHLFPYQPYVAPLIKEILPLHPRSFRIKVITNHYLSQKEYVHRLTWVSSLDQLTTHYKIYRNGKVIDTIKAEGHTFTYEDRSRTKYKKEAYGLTAVVKSGKESLLIKPKKQ